MEQLFRSDGVMDGLQKAAERPVRPETAGKYIIIELAGARYALSSEFAREVSEIDRIYFFPPVDPWLTGLVNLRGDVHSVISLREILGIGRAERERMLIIVSSPALTTAVAIDNILDVADIPDDAINRYQDEKDRGEYLSGMFDFKGSSVILVNISRILADFGERLASADE